MTTQFLRDDERVIERLAQSDSQKLLLMERLIEARTELEQLQKKLEAWQRAAPLCEQHQPNGGARATCLICALQVLSRAISEIDYLIGKPNEMHVSNYDVHQDEAQVVSRVAALQQKYEVAVQALRVFANISVTELTIGNTIQQWAREALARIGKVQV